MTDFASSPCRQSSLHPHIAGAGQCDTTVCSVTTGVTFISPYRKDVYAPYIPRYLPIIYGDAEQYLVSITMSQIGNLHCTDESKIMHVKERVSHMLPSYVCMQPITCRTRIEQTKESACNIDAPEISKVTCMHGKLVHYVATTSKYPVRCSRTLLHLF